MRKSLLWAGLLLAAPRGLAAQTEVYARLGAVGASNLLRDVIVNEITVHQSIAPMAALGGSLPLGREGYRAGLEGTFASGKFHSTESGVEVDLGTLRTGTLMADLEGPVRRDLRWRLGLGLIHYWPGEDDGIFRQGGTTRLLAGLGLDFRRPVSSSLDLMTSLRYDFHRFTTAELETQGFAQTQAISRLSLSVGISRGGR